MQYLLDTHTLLWFTSGDSQLSVKAKNAILDPDATKYVSIASLWEIAIKISTGKLKLDMPFSELNQDIHSNGFEILPIAFNHTLRVSTLDFHHRDPFDRIIISQGLVEHYTIITRDEQFADYTDKILW